MVFSVKNNSSFSKNHWPLVQYSLPSNVGIINTLPYDLYFKNLAHYGTHPLHSAFLLNHNWPFHMDAISQKKYLKDIFTPNIYTLNIKHFGIQPEQSYSSIIKFFEINTLTFFSSYLQDNINVTLYKKNSTLTPDLMRQSSPDILLDFSTSKYRSLQKFSHKVLSLDQKTSVNITQPENKILNNTPMYYKLAVKTYLQCFNNPQVDLKELLSWCQRLEDSCENFNEHINIWKEGLIILQYQDYLPPIRIPCSFNTQYLNTQAINVYNSSLAHYMDIIKNASPENLL